MNTKKLKQLVLDLAIHGKLVPQDPNDEPASELLKRIQAEKAKSAKGKKCKIVEEDTIPFEIPIGWTWCTMDEIAFVTKLAGFEYTKYIVDNLSNISGVPLFKGKNVQDGHIVYEFESYIPENISDELCRSQITRKCLLTPYVGTIGNIGIHDRNGKYHLGSNVGKIEVYNGETTFIKEEYLWYFLRSSSGYSELTKNKKATAQESISIDAIREVYIPLPPLAEQHRIVAAIEKWFAVIDQLEKNEADLKKSIEQTKKKVLDLAIRGKLVAQNPEDEPAGELIKRINPKAEILFESDDYGEVPEGWCLVSVGDLNEYKSGGINPLDNKDTIYELYSVPIYSSGYPEISKGKDIGSTKQKVEKDDVLLCKINPHLNRVWVVSHHKKELQCLASSEWVVLRSSITSPEYLKYALSSEYFRLLLNSNVSGVGGSLTRAQPMFIKKYLIPLPPLAEQKRIVEKIEEVMGVLERIEGMV